MPFTAFYPILAISNIVGGRGGIIKPVVIDSFWHRRIGEAVTFISLAILLAYGGATFLGGEFFGYLSISPVAAILAAVSLGTGISTRLLARQLPIVRISSPTSYLLCLAAVSWLIYETGLGSSPFLFLWPLVTIFSGVFGLIGLAPTLLVGLLYLFMQLVEPAHSLTLLSLLVTLLPIGFSVVIWGRSHAIAEHAERDPAAYKQQSTEIASLIEGSEMLINAIGDGVLAIDNQGVVQLINPAAQTLLGWSRRDAVTLKYESVLKLMDEEGKVVSEVSEPIKQTLNTNQEHRSKALQLETKGGKRLFISLVASPLGDAGGGVVAIIRDITKERSEEREQAEFISTASHEMRTPVASIEGYLGLALNPATAAIDEKAREYIQKAQEAAKHLGRLFQDLLDVSKAEDGRLSSNPEVLDVVDYAGQVIEGLQHKATEKGLQLAFKPSPKSGERGERNITPMFYAHLDRDHLRELISNLTENAIKYTREGEVSIDVTGNDQHITISVSDTGIGIPAEDIPHLFQKFYRVDNSDTREIGGTGLGLFLSRRLAETLGGRIWVESVHQQGSTFFVELPRLEGNELRRLQAQEAAQQKEAPPSTPVTPPPPTAEPVPAAQITQPPPPPVAPQPTPVPQPQQPQPQVQPAPAPQPTIQQPAPAPIPQQPAPTQAPTAPTAPQRPNTPLTTIEQNPAAYTNRPATPTAVPPRNSSQRPN